MLKGLGNWLRKVSRSRMLRRIDRIMGLSDMELGRKTRKYFLRLRRSLNMRRRLLNLSDRIHNLGEFWDFDDFQTNYMMYINIIVIIGFIGFIIDPKFLSSIDTTSIILTLALPIILFFGRIFLLIVTTSSDDYDWPDRYKSRITHTGLIGKIMNRLWKNSDSLDVKSTNDNRFFSSYFEGFNQMASLLNMDMDYLDEPEYWSDENYGKFMRIVLSYAFIYESTDGHPDKDTLSEFINSDEIQNTAREVLNDVRERKNRILDADTSVDTSTEESSSTIENKPDPVIVSQTNDRTDPNIIRSEDIQSKIVDKTEKLHNILDSEMQIEK